MSFVVCNEDVARLCFQDEWKIKLISSCTVIRLSLTAEMIVVGAHLPVD